MSRQLPGLSVLRALGKGWIVPRNDESTGPCGVEGRNTKGQSTGEGNDGPFSTPRWVSHLRTGTAATDKMEGGGVSVDCSEAGSPRGRRGRGNYCVHVHLRSQRLKGGEGENEWRRQGWPPQGHWVGGDEEEGDRWVGSSGPGLAQASRLLQAVATSPVISGDFPEDGEHGVPDAVSQSGDVLRR